MWELICPSSFFFFLYSYLFNVYYIIVEACNFLQCKGKRNKSYRCLVSSWYHDDYYHVCFLLNQTFFSITLLLVETFQNKRVLSIFVSKWHDTGVTSCLGRLNNLSFQTKNKPKCLIILNLLQTWHPYSRSSLTIV